MNSNNFYNGIKENLKKARNPFFATLITVWIIRNWKLIYAVFTFDKNYDFNDRVEYLSKYFGDSYVLFWDFWNTFYGDLVICILISIIAFLISLFLKNWSRLIAEKADAQIREWTQKINKTPTLEEYKTLQNERDDYLLKIEKVSKSSTELEARIEYLKSQIERKEENIEKKEKEILANKKSYYDMTNERDSALASYRKLSSELENNIRINGNLPFPQKPLTGINLIINGSFNYVINIPFDKEIEVGEMLLDLINSENSGATFNFKLNKLKKEFKTLTIFNINIIILNRFIRLLNSKSNMHTEDGKILL